jgi:protein involved in polysaccharide export with SLBB domain
MKFTKVKQDEVRYGAINFQENDVVIVQLNDYAERDEVDAVGQAFRTAISERGLKKVTLIITQGHMDV